MLDVCTVNSEYVLAITWSMLLLTKLRECHTATDGSHKLTLRLSDQLGRKASNRLKSTAIRARANDDGGLAPAVAGYTQPR